MKTARRHRLAIIGCGNIALTGHLPAALQHPRFDVRGLCDIAPERLEAARRLCRGKEIAASTSFEALLSDRSFDACILALHPEHSVRIAAALLRKGIAVLDEKPLAARLDDGLRLAKIIRQTHGVYQIGFCLRYSGLFREVKRMLPSLGRPRLFQVAIYDEGLAQCRGKYGGMIKGILRRSSAVTHEGSHVIDWMSLLHPAPIRSVKASTLRTLPGLPGPNVWICAFDYADGSALQLNIGWMLRRYPPTALRIIGSKGWLELDLFRGAGHLTAGSKTRLLRLPPMRQCWREQLDAFAEAIDRGKAAIATVHDGLRALRATLACERAAARNQSMPVETCAGA